jgi:hypothetical protein
MLCRICAVNRECENSDCGREAEKMRRFPGRRNADDPGGGSKFALVRDLQKPST